MKKLNLIWLVLLIFFCVGSALAQTNSNPCENFNKKDYQGENITINVEKTDIRDILQVFTKKVGCEFIIDKSVKKVPLDVEVSEVPWNILLDAILRSQDLGSQVVGKSLFRIAKAETLFTEELCTKGNLGKEPLYTEFIKLKYLTADDSNSRYCFCTYEKNYVPTPSKIFSFVSKLLSNRGAIETDSRSNSLVITDTKERVDLILKKLREWDKPDTNLDEIIKNFESKKQL